MKMAYHIHHVHIFASDIERSLDFYRGYFGGEVVLDMEFAGARNVFMKIGTGRIHFYDQPPKTTERGGIHHFGIQTDDLDGTVERMKSSGVFFRKGITDFGFWRYVMVPAPDDIVIELFEVDKEKIPEAFRGYFE